MADPQQTSQAKNKNDGNTAIDTVTTALSDTAQKIKRPIKERAKGFKAFWKEIWDDLDFWINTGAAKAGASAILMGGIVALSYAVTLPFALSALAIVGAGTLLGVGVYALTTGTLSAIHRAEKIYRRHKGLPEKPHKESGEKMILDKIRQNKIIQKIHHSKPVQAFVKTPLWQKSSKFAQKQQKKIMGSLAITGQVASIGFVAAWMMTQVMILPFIAAATVISITAYTTVHFIREYLHKKKAKKAEDAAEASKDKAPEKMDMENTIDITPHVSVKKQRQLKKPRQGFKQAADHENKRKIQEKPNKKHRQNTLKK